MIVKPVIRSFHSPDALDLTAYKPDDPVNFGLLLEFSVGDEDESEGADDFGVVVCTPAWLQHRLENGKPYPGRHHLIVPRWNYDIIREFIEEHVRTCTGSTWKEVAQKIGRFALWEFEDYRE